MKYKLLVIDVDGTLLNDQKQITPHTKSAILKAQQMGVHIVLASGRPTGGILPLAKELELNNYGGYVISYNGAQIIEMQTGNLLFEKRINPELIPYLDKKAKKNNYRLCRRSLRTARSKSQQYEYPASDKFPQCH